MRTTVTDKSARPRRRGRATLAILSFAAAAMSVLPAAASTQTASASAASTSQPAAQQASTTATVAPFAETTALPAVASPCDGNPFWCSGITRVRQFPNAWISLETRLGSDHHEYAYGHGHIPENRWLYLDVKQPDGVYRGWVNKVKGHGTGSFSSEVKTGSVFDGPGYQVRACTDTAGVFTCTGWH